MAKFELKVFITSREAPYDECGGHLGRKAWIMLVEDKGAPCLTCADLDHLLFLPAGDATLTRRSAAARSFDEQAIRLAVAAHARNWSKYAVCDR